MDYTKFIIFFNSENVYLNFSLFQSIISKKTRILSIGDEIFAERNSLFASVLSAAIFGMEVREIQVEADVSDGLPSFTMVGFPSAQVREAQERVRTAFKNNRLSLPPKRVTVNFAPADMKKEGAGFDLPVAAAVLAAAQILEPKLLEKVMVVGEISLNGEIHGVSGILPRVIRARELGLRFCIIPQENIQEGKLVRDIQVFGVKTLKDMIRCLQAPEKYENEGMQELKGEETDKESVDFTDVCGQEGARRAAEIAVSGFHNILFIGPPGSGKTMLARRLPTIMPRLTFEESLEITKVYSVAGLLTEKDPLIKKRPFRSPHHTSSAQALAGGGRIPGPGEITLAHRGVLFLDEMPEFSRKSLEILRQPLEDKEIHLSRAAGTYRFPASFMLAAAMNPCPCGFYPDMNRCRCSHGEITHYLGKISQPLLERIDICTEVPAIQFMEMKKRKRGESSASIRQRVERTQEFQRERYKNEKFSFNGELDGRSVEKYCVMTGEAEALLEQAYTQFQFSTRAYHKILKVARTVADMEASEKLQPEHVCEALTYRAYDKKYWS